MLEYLHLSGTEKPSTLGGMRYMGRKYVIFSDLTCDLTRQERINYGIWPEVYEQDVTYNGEPVDLSDPGEFYRRLENEEYEPGSLKTAASGYENVAKVLDDIIEHTAEGTTIVYAGISPYMSAGSVNMVNMVFDDYRKEHPEYEFVIVDTQSISNGLGTYLQYLADYDGDFIEEYAHELGKHIVHLFTESNLNYTAKSGRYNMIEQIFMCGMTKLHLSPWMFFPSDDKLTTDKRPRRGDKILHEWVDYYIEHVADDNRFIRIGYGGEKSLKRAEKFIRLLECKAGVTRDQIQLAYVSPIVGAHTGDTVLSFFFKQKDER